MKSPREDLQVRYAAVRAATEALAAPLSPEDQQLQSMPSCSPTKWHRAHTTWFFEEFVLAPRGHAPHREGYRYLFNSYYEAVGPRHPRPSRGLLSRPSCDEIAGYRRAVDARMLDLLGGLGDREAGELRPLLELGLAHEEQHQELLLTDILHALSLNPLRPAYRMNGTAPAAEPAGRCGDRATEALRFVDHPGGLVSIGAGGEAGFTFDNEGPRHKVWLEPFAIATRPISMGEVRAFVEAGGYDDASLWLAEGFDFVQSHGLRAPLYAHLEAGGWRGFSLEGEVATGDHEPACHLSYYEADALARFLGGRLPTEAEWEVAAAAPSMGIGDVWEWTSSAYQPYPGFAPARGAVGEYNGKFMVNQMVLRGGSRFTPAGHVRPSYRNFWPAETRFQRSGARLARGGAR